MMEMFKAGDRVMHNFYGLCKIRAIEAVNDADYGRRDCYVIYVEGTKIMIPISYADTLRYPMKKEDVPKVLETLAAFEEAPDGISSGEAVEMYTKKIASNGVLENAECLRGLTLLGEKNILIGSARNLMERVNRILEDEITLVKNMGKGEAQRLINQHLNKARGRTGCSKRK